MMKIQYIPVVVALVARAVDGFDNGPEVRAVVDVFVMVLVVVNFLAAETFL